MAQPKPLDLLPGFTPATLTPEVRAHINRIDGLARQLVDAIDAMRKEFPEEAGTKPNPVKARLLKFDELHRVRFGMPAPIAWGKDTGIMKRIVDRFGEDETDKLIAEFFALDDDFIQKRGFSVSIFSGNIAGIISRRSRVVKGHGITRNTEQNREQTALAVKMLQQRGAAPPANGRIIDHK